MQDLATTAAAPSFQPQATAVTGRRLAGAQEHSRRLAQDTGGGVQVKVLVQAPADLNGAVASAIEQATSSGQFQAALNSAGETDGRVSLLRVPALCHSTCGL